MRSRAFNIAAALSLALLVVSLVQWARSQYRQGFSDSRSGQEYGAYFNGGQGRLDCGVIWGPMSISGTRITMVTRNIVQRGGIEVRLVQVSSPSTRTRQMSIALYAWQAAVFTGALPALQLYRWCRRRAAERINHAVCWKCGYDLRATPDRCPECGTIMANPAAA